MLSIFCTIWQQNVYIVWHPLMYRVTLQSLNNLGTGEVVYTVTVIWAKIVVVQYTKIMDRPDISTVPAYVLSGLMYRPELSGWL